MYFESYWGQLVDRVHRLGEPLVGKEALFYRWSCIYGETMVDGIEAYFERRFAEFDADMEALQVAGFSDIESDFREARKILFGDAPLDETLVAERTDALLTESPEVRPVLAEINTVYRRLIPRLERLARYKYDYGVRERLFAADPR